MQPKEVFLQFFYQLYSIHAKYNCLTPTIIFFYGKKTQDINNRCRN